MDKVFIYTLLGGAFAGVAVTLILLFNCQIIGVNGILSETLNLSKKDIIWRISFLFGLFIGAISIKYYNPNLVEHLTDYGLGSVVLAGFLVGIGSFGNSKANGNYEAPDINRFSPRPIFSTVIFIILGILTAFVFRILWDAN